MKKDFITVTPDSGKSGSTTVTATSPANQTESKRSVNLSVSGGGMTRTVTVNQAAAVVTWNYYFSVTPTSLSFVADGESKSVTVTSYRKKVINGVETSIQENVQWTSAISDQGFIVNLSGTLITAQKNPGKRRSGRCVYTQRESGKTAFVSLNQSGVRYTITYKTNGSFEDIYFAFNSNSTPVESPLKYAAFMGGISDFENSWSPDTGYSVNNVLGGSIRLKAGDIVWIRKMIGAGRSWDSSTIQLFTLEAGNQTVQLD